MPTDLKTEFLSVVSHEIRTPLTIIKSAVSNLSDQIVGPISSEQKKVLDIAQRNIDRLSRMINNLLDVSRLESGRFKWVGREVFLGALLEQSVKDVLTPKIDLRISTKKSVLADADLLLQVIANLLDNALRYAKKRVKISLTESTIDHKIILSFEDDGPGIAPDDLPRLFKKFEQLQRPQGGSGYKGTGLGLAIVKEIVELHFGTIQVQSTPNIATVFQITLHAFKPSHLYMNIITRSLESFKSLAEVFAIILVNMHPNSPEVEWLQKMMQLSRDFREKGLRGADQLHFDREKKCFIIILANALPAVAKTVLQRLKTICPQDLPASFNMACYPHDNSNPYILLEQLTRENL